jgi:hypothetical protein
MQTSPLKSFLLIGAGAAAVWMATNPKENGARIKNLTTEIKERFTSTKEQNIVPIQQAASPDPYDSDNNDMVSEGSVYGVNYYNENVQN